MFLVFFHDCQKGMFVRLMRVLTAPTGLTNILNVYK